MDPCKWLEGESLVNTWNRADIKTPAFRLYSRYLSMYLSIILSLYSLLIWTRCTWYSSAYVGALGVYTAHNLEIVIDCTWWCTWRGQSSKFPDAPGSGHLANMEVNLELPWGDWSEAVDQEGGATEVETLFNGYLIIVAMWWELTLPVCCPPMVGNFTTSYGHLN